jgi:hypothetical protein
MSKWSRFYYETLEKTLATVPYKNKKVFYGTQYHPVPPVEKDSYVI